AAEVGSEEETVLRPPLRKLIPWHDEPNNEGGNHHRNEEGDKRVESALHHAECGTLNRRHLVDIEVPSELACILYKQKRRGGPRVSDNPAAPVIRSMVAEIVSSYVKKNQIAPADIPALINTVYLSLLAAGEAPEPEQNRTPAVPIRQSVRPNYVVCLECG